VSFDSEKANKKFAEKYGFTFPLLCDTERAMGVAYGAADDTSAKSAKRIGVVIGPDGKVKHYFSKVDARGFPEEALGLV
jgi:peroxiredoxin Q/BCP